MKNINIILALFLSVLLLNSCSQKEEYFDTSGYVQTENVAPIADFTYEIVLMDEFDAQINLYDKSINNPTEWKWLIGDETNENQNVIGKNIWDLELTPVTLTAKNNVGENSVTKNIDLRLSSFLAGSYQASNTRDGNVTNYDEIIYKMDDKYYFLNFANFANIDDNIYFIISPTVNIPTQTINIDYEVEHRISGSGSFELKNKEITIKITYSDFYGYNYDYCDMVLTRTIE